MATASGPTSEVVDSESPVSEQKPEKDETKHPPPPASLPATAVSPVAGTKEKPHGNKKQKRKYMIKTMEKKLEILDRQIKKYSEAEVSMEEMLSGSSAYMKEDLLKRKFVHTWQRLCDLQNISDDLEIEDQESLNYSGTSYPEINRRVQRLLRYDEFPDHFDICQLIERCNTKHSLGISAEERSQLSRKVFKEVGKLLKRRRQKDFITHFGSHLTDRFKVEEDPAVGDDQLFEKLKTSLREGQEKLERICDEFIIRQEQEFQEGGGKSPEGDSCSENEKEEEEEEEVGLEEEEEVEGVEVEIEGEEMEIEGGEFAIPLESGESLESGANTPSSDTSGKLPDVESDNTCSGEPSKSQHAPDTTVLSESDDTLVTSSQGAEAAGKQVSLASDTSSSSIDVTGSDKEDQKQPMAHNEETPTSSNIIFLSDSDEDVIVVSDTD